MKNNKNYKVKIKQDTKEFAILSILNECGEMFLDAMLPKQYPQAMLWRKILGLDNNKISKKQEEKIYNTMSRLRNKGLIQKKRTQNGIMWKINKTGKEVMLKLKLEKLPEKDGKIRIIIFDIPEKHKEHRIWLRKSLINSRYKLLQRSVWVGVRPLPENIFLEIKNKNIFEDIHIFEIKNEGTLENLIID